MAGKKISLLLCSLAIVGIYFLLFGHYRASEVDDAWTASYVWNLTHNGQTDDQVFGLVSNIQYFGHVHAYIFGYAADNLGWNKSTFHLLNLALVLGSAVAWFLTARVILGSTVPALLFTLLLFMLEPFVGAAYKARSDAMAFFLCSWGTAAAVYGRFFLSALAVSLAVETHAVAGIGYFWIVAVLAHNYFISSGNLNRAGRQGLSALCGCLLGFIIYRLIHPEPLREIFTYLAQSNTAIKGWHNVLSAHYFSREYFRFIPELIFWLLGSFLFFKNRKKISSSALLPVLFGVTLLVSCMLQRSNFHYVIFFYPFIFLLAFAGYWSSSLRYPALFCICIYSLLLSGGLYVLNKDVDHHGLDVNLSRINIPNDGTPIIGLPGAWFALRERDFYASYAAMRKDKRPRPEHIYYVASMYTNNLPSCAEIVSKVGQGFEFNRTRVQVYLVNLRKCPP